MSSFSRNNCLTDIKTQEKLVNRIAIVCLVEQLHLFAVLGVCIH